VVLILVLPPASIVFGVSSVFGVGWENRQRQKRNAGVSPLRCAPVEMTAFGVVKRTDNGNNNGRLGKGMRFPNHRPIRRAQDGAPECFGVV
jgi:hypothetical protein